MRDDKFKKLLEANQILSSTLNIRELLRRIMELATEVVEAETSSILLYDEQSDELVFDLALTDKESKLKEMRIKAGEGIAGWVAKEKKARIVNDIKEEHSLAHLTDNKIDFHTHSVLAVPLIYKEKFLGVVEAVNKKKGVFDGLDTECLSAFAAQAAVAIENAKLFENLIEEKEKMWAIFSQMSDGAIFMDAKGKSVIVNKEAEKLLGSENTARKTVFEMFRDFDCEPGFSKLMSDAELFIPFELKRTKDKTLFISGVSSKVLDVNGAVIGLIFVFRDTTAEKRESMLKASFISLMSHKLKTPLVSIIGYGPLLLSEKSLTGSQRRAIESIDRQGNILSSLVDKLLYFTLLEGEKLTLNKRPSRYIDVLNRSIDLARQSIDQSSVKISVGEGVGKMPSTRFDVEKVEAVLRNLIENAIKFNKNADKFVIISPVEENGMSGLSVCDNGPGVPPEEREKIFQKFYQVEESFTGQVEGAGLGLAIVKQVVEAHGGTVGLKSEIGKGSEFYFLIPK